MKTEIMFSTRDLVGGLRDGLYDLLEGASVAALLAAAEREAGQSLSEDVRDCLLFLVGSRLAAWDTVLHDGDKVRVLFKILGG